jgi:hypothetical protein
MTNRTNRAIKRHLVDYRQVDNSADDEYENYLRKRRDRARKRRRIGNSNLGCGNCGGK